MNAYNCTKCGAGLYSAAEVKEPLCAECELDDNLVEVVRCKNCQYRDTEDCPSAERQCFRNNIGVIKERWVTGDYMDYCSYGERRAG